MNNDLTDLMNAWPYDSDRNVRIVVANDGRSVLQVRLPLGIEQYELEGRPDGVRPFESNTYVEHVEQLLKSHILRYGSDLGFEINGEHASQLQAEGALFYYRYVLLFQLNRFERVVRDSEHNLHLCDLLERYCPDEEARNAILQYRPYILRMRGASLALAVHQGDAEGDAVSIARDTIDAIESLDEIDTPAFQFERVRSVNYLQTMITRLEGNVDEADGDDPVKNLELELKEAVESEDYERAASVRDQIRTLRGPDDVG